MKKTLYIAYGSNLNLEQMAHRCPTAKVVGKSKLSGYELLFRGGYGGAVATVEKAKGTAVPVLVWQLQPSDEVALDRYEGFPSFYRKETAKVRLGKDWTEVMVYIMNDGRALGAPSRYYFEVIKQGYESAGFDTEILNKAVKQSSEGGR
ncbi:MAG: gamma-glutamylcyclotransferase family protein [Bacillota bacterium]